jgi:hypothetical protein
MHFATQVSRNQELTQSGTHYTGICLKCQLTARRYLILSLQALEFT